MCILPRLERIFVITGEFLTQWPPVPVTHKSGEAPSFSHNHLTAMCQARRRPQSSDCLSYVIFITWDCSAERGGYLSWDIVLSFTHFSHCARLWGCKDMGQAFLCPVPLVSYSRETQRSYGKEISASGIQVVRVVCARGCREDAEKGVIHLGWRLTRRNELWVKFKEVMN